VIVTGVVVANDWPVGSDPLTLVGGSSMLAHAVRCLLDCGLVEHVVVLHRPEQVDVVTAACSGLPVSVRASFSPAPVRPHSAQRADGRCGDDRIAPDPPEIVLVHDAARPLAPPALAVAVVDAVRSGYAAAVPVLPMSDTVKQVNAAGMVLGSVDRATLRVVQTPQAIRRELLVGPPLRAAIRLAATDPAAVHAVAGHPLAFAVRTAWDLELARLLFAQGAAAEDRS